MSLEHNSETCVEVPLDISILPPPKASASAPCGLGSRIPVLVAHGLIIAYRVILIGIDNAYTSSHSNLMKKARPTSLHAAANPKGSINSRAEAHAGQLAIRGMPDQRVFTLDAKRYAAFLHVLDNPPAPGPRLRSLLRRVPAWKA
jgi:uncharacterized protein (DUF1778 family)